METATFNGVMADAPISVETELFNFGYAPFEVIQKFQDFCMNYTSLTEAILEIMERETLLKRKYTFIIAPVMYQMLARPTANDSDYLLISTIDALKKFTRRGRYDSVANALEELLFSPSSSGETYCDKATWTAGNVGTSCTELSESEQNVLEKIADALLNKLSSVVPPPKRRRTVSKVRRFSNEINKAIKISPQKGKSGERPILPSPFIGIKFPQINTAIAQATTVAKEPHATVKFSSSHLCPIGQALKHNHIRDPVDASVAVPIKNYLKKDSESPTKKKPVSNDNCDASLLQKEEFMEGFLHLLPSINAAK